MKACKDCGHVGEPVVITKGQFWVEVAMWLLFILPGVVYSVWRLASRVDGCASCGSQNLIPIDSPQGKQITAVYEALNPPAPYVPSRPKPGAVAIGRKLGRLFAKK